MASTDRVTLYGLMVKPIQRFPQFILLLQVWVTPCFAPYFGRHSASGWLTNGLVLGMTACLGLVEGFLGLSLSQFGVFLHHSLELVTLW